MTVTIRTFDPVTNTFIIPDVVAANKYKLGEVPSTHTQVSVMRPSVLGNPFRIGTYDGKTVARGEGVKLHQTWFREQMLDETSAVRAEIFRLAERVANGEKLALVCCCKPLACHADIMCAAILGYANRIKAGNN